MNHRDNETKIGDALPDNPPPIQENTTPCPKCHRPILAGSAWCPHCGAGRPSSYHHSQGPKKYTIAWYWFLILFLVAPLAICGGCFAIGSEAGFAIATGLQLATLVTGFILFIVNIARGPQPK